MKYILRTLRYNVSGETRYDTLEELLEEVKDLVERCGMDEHDELQITVDEEEDIDQC